MSEVVDEQVGFAEEEVPSFATAEEMLRKRKCEVEMNEPNDDDDEEVNYSGDNEYDDETNERGLVCWDCGFQVQWSTL